MNKKSIVAIWILLSAFFLSSCTNDEVTTSEPTVISVISLRENLPEMEKEAKKWRNDAYLVWLEIPIRSDLSGNPLLIAAAFNSPEMEFEGVLVDLTADGSITLERIEQSVPVYQQTPITEDDWEIGSQEALDLMLDQEGLEFLLNNPESQSSFITLERTLSDPEQPLVWRLTLTKFLGETTRYIRLDPKTGEILEDS